MKEGLLSLGERTISGPSRTTVFGFAAIPCIVRG